MVRTKSQDRAAAAPAPMASRLSRRLPRPDAGSDPGTDRDVIEDSVLETSRDSVEVDDEISIGPVDFQEKDFSNSPKDSHLRPERWKYKTRKKRKKSDEEEDENIDARVNENIVEDSVDLDLQAIRKKYVKMSKIARQSEYGKELYNMLNGPKTKHGLDSTGNSENHSSSLLSRSGN